MTGELSLSLFSRTFSAPQRSGLSLIRPVGHRSKSQDRISSVPHFKTQVQQGGDSFDVHYIASFSSNPRAIPLLVRSPLALFSFGRAYPAAKR